jgi:transposase
LSWSEVASIFRTSWDSVFRAVDHAVEWGLARRDLSKLKALGIDEIAWSCGHHYLTLVYDIGGEVRRLLAVAEDRTEASLRLCLDGLGEATYKQVQYVCSDMWKPYLNVIAEKLGDAIHVLDRFHIMQKFGKAIDEIRGGVDATAAGRLRAGLEALAVVLSEASGEQDGQGDGETVGDSPIQPADSASVSSA